MTAKSQTLGEGRLGRVWISPVGGLYMSFVLRPKGLARPELFTLTSSVAVVQGVRNTTGFEPTIRWPNDVMLNRKKLAGVIAQAQSLGKELTHVVVGIGVNCNAPVSETKILKGEATSIVEASGRNQDITALRDSILDSFSNLYNEWSGGADMARRWEAHLGIPKVVTVKLKISETPFSCIARSVDGDGSLIVTKGRDTAVIRAEDLEWLREES